MKKTLLTIAACTTLLSAGGDIAPIGTSSCGLYTDEYMMYSGIVHPCIDTGIPNYFEGEKLLDKKMYFHASLYFKKGVLTETSLEALKTLQNTIKSRGSNYYVSVVGYTAWYEDDMSGAKLNAWSTFWQNLGKADMTLSELAGTVNQRIEAVYTHLTNEEGLSSSRLYTENRLARDPIATEAIEEGRQRNTRVDVALYY